MKLDKKDKRILLAISSNARSPISRIAKKISLSREATKNRIQKLQRTGIIKGYKTKINYDKLGYKRYDLYFRFNRYTKTTEEKILKYFVEHKFTTWVGTCFGAYDIRITLIAKNNQHLNKLLQEIETELGDYLYEYETCPVIKQYRINSRAFINYLIDEKPEKELIKEVKGKEQKEESKIILDKKDKKILSIMTKNPLVSLVTISKQLKIKPEAVKYRIKRLEKQGIIKGYQTIIDGLKLNKIWCILLIKLKNMGPETEKGMESYMLQEIQATTSAKTIGKWNLMLGLFANNMEDIQEMVLRFRARFSENVKDYDALLIFKMHKYPSYIKGLIE